ncbi:16S rRNA (guanine(966)-N(2))-methyltransferase RsmD [Natribacillus halophilus]|uniref:16S rRNA (Guanine(966)-N(2))-methyltransferase RsmD n=1 Tax=Natribacillus halophilus TaxID=549003 RepID=A0A1G8MDL0_9BACI|nr:16S rRNA (guanine(966)-N(2))-methyltransferase RsmD [Natribacillus halophilus]
MRVITGKRKGTRLKAVPGANTRPTSDRVKEALFQMIGPYFHGGIGLDLYAGSGALGIEALSRGLEKVYFADKAGAAIKVIRENVKNCRFENEAYIYKREAAALIKHLGDEKRKFSLVLLDPPYEEQQLVRDITLMQDFELTTPETMIVTEHATAIALSEEIGHFRKNRAKTYGDTQISMYTYQNIERNEQEW